MTNRKCKTIKHTTIRLEESHKDKLDVLLNSDAPYKSLSALVRYHIDSDYQLATSQTNLFTLNEDSLDATK